MSIAPNDRVPLLIPVRVIDEPPALRWSPVDVQQVIGEQGRGHDATLDWRTVAHASLSRGYPKRSEERRVGKECLL